MAKKIQKTIKKRDNRQFIIIGVFVVVVTMILSGIYFISDNKGNTETPDENHHKEPVIDKYQINQIGNSSVVVNISGVTSDVIVIPDSRCVYFETINEIQTISDKVTVSSEVADPSVISQPEPMMCGFYIMFKFNIGGGNNSLNLNSIKQKLGKSSVFRGYTANLPGSSEADTVYIVGQPGINAGDYLRITLYQKIANGLQTGMIGFGERKVPVGPVLSAAVVNITDIIAQGAVDTDLPPNIQERLNAIEFNFLPPKIRINKTIENKTAEMLDNLTGVSALMNSEQTITEISFNSSKSDVLRILGNENISYSLQDGGLLFKIPLNSDIDSIRKILTDSNVKDVRFGKEGAVSLPKEFMLDTTPVPIRNNDRFAAVLGMDRKIGDRINVSMNTIRFGDQIIAFGASEVTNQASSI